MISILKDSNERLKIDSNPCKQIVGTLFFRFRLHVQCRTILEDLAKFDLHPESSSCTSPPLLLSNLNFTDEKAPRHHLLP